MEIPVFLFTGFLESGKTKFIQETLQDERFKDELGTLLIVCEEGEIEYQPEKFVCQDVVIKYISSVDEIEQRNLTKMQKEAKAGRVIIEYNGMWQLSELYANMPRNWLIYQQFMFANSQNIEFYNANMRNIVADKFNDAELIVFNRCTEKTDKMALHKLVRGVSRKADIAFENVNGDVEYDEIKDPLPFDVNADVIEIKDIDYAIWYMDLAENKETYNNKTVKFKGTCAVDRFSKDNSFVIGRHIMTCCAEDIAYRGLVCVNSIFKPKNRDWLTVTAKVVFEEHKLYKGIGPVLHIKSVETANKPDEEVVTLY